MTDDSQMKYGVPVEELVTLVKEQFPKAVADAERSLKDEDDAASSS